LYISNTSAQNACDGGNQGVSGTQYSVTTDTGDMCTATTFTIAELPTLDLFNFWISDGSNSRALQRSGGPLSTIAVPTAACAVCQTSTPTPTPTLTPTATPVPTPTPTLTPTPTPASGFAITLYGRGNSTGDACSALGEKTVYVATAQIQSDYTTFGFGTIGGQTLYENINLSSTVADPYAADLNLNVYAINTGVVGALTISC
jgi:hypothetical protein